jgi:hypothetical protein
MVAMPTLQKRARTGFAPIAALVKRDTGSGSAARMMVETQRQAAGRATAPQKCLERRRDDRKVALFQLTPQRVRTTRQHYAVIE